MMASQKHKQVLAEEKQDLILDQPIGWLEAGTKKNPLMIFLHGYPDTPWVWRYQIRHFKKNYHVVCPYLRGVGPSIDLKDINLYTPEATSELHLALIEKLTHSQKSNVIVIGHDIGSAHAWALASLLGTRLDKLIILNGIHPRQLAKRFMINPKQFLKSYYMYFFFLPKFPEWFLEHIPSQVITKLQILSGFPKQDLRDENSIVKDRCIAGLNHYKAGLLSLCKSLMKKTTSLERPVLALHAQSDCFLEPPTVKEFKSYAKKIKIRLMPGHHWLQLEHPHDVNKVISDFIKTN